MPLAAHHGEIRDAVRRFAREQLWPNAPAWDRDKHFPREQLKALAGMGLFGIAIAEEWGGAGLDYTSLAIAMEEVSAGDAATGTIIGVNNLVAGILSGYGNARQKEAFLAGRSAPDFAPINFEVDFKGRATLDDLTPLGRKQMGF